jgi:hypothetical protein
MPFSRLPAFREKMKGFTATLILATALACAAKPAMVAAQITGPHLSPQDEEQVNASAAVYLDCLRRGAASLALASDEPAETIVDAASGLCLQEAQALLDLDDRLNIVENMVDAVKSFRKGELLLIVIKARAKAARTPSK